MTKVNTQIQGMEPPTWKEQGYVPARYVVAIMAFFGMVFNYMLRININITITAMVKAKNYTDNSSIVDPCHYGNDNIDSKAYDGELEWDEFTQSLVIGSFFWGYIWTQVPGGRLAEVIGNRRVYGSAILGSAILTLFIPLTSRISPIAVMINRFLMGICQGPTFPSTHALLATWAPPLERSFMATIILAGSQAGTIITYPIAAGIIDGLGWASVFYIQAGLTIIWALLWFFIVTDQPEDFRWISEEEKTYIQRTVAETKQRKSPPVPWKAIFTSIPFWAIVVAGFGNNWGFYTLLTDLPIYMKEMLHKDINANALLSGMPYLGMWIFSLICSSAGDKLRQNNVLTTGTVRKIANSIAHMGPAICLFSLSLVECNRRGTVGLLFTAVTLQGGIYTGFIVNLIDIAPNFAGTLYGITNAVASIPAWVAPLTVGALTNDGRQTFSQWEKVFYIAGAIYLFDGLVFLFFSSGEVQKWNKVEEEEEEVEESKKNNFNYEINKAFAIETKDRKYVLNNPMDI